MREKTYAPGDRVCVEISFLCGDAPSVREVEAVFAREGNAAGEEITLLGDAEETGRGTYSARPTAVLDPGTRPGEYRCVRLRARDRFDDDHDFAAGLDLAVRVERVPRRLEVTASEFV